VSDDGRPGPGGADLPRSAPRRIGGRYLLADRLGSGAMGTVWSGFDELLRRRVAVKELLVPPGVPAGEALAMRERMLREARALAGLSHPNVITVYDVVDVEGEPMVVLEMVPSRNLAMMISERGALSPEQAAVVGFATAAALRAAHRARITHRDVKPANVLVADDGRVKLTDFGIARNSADAPMTTAGLVLGSPAYIAPEVAAGEAVTPAADLWGLGATLFAAVEGRPPYDVRGDPVSTITEVVDGQVPRPHLTGPVADVIGALMVKDPARRMALDEVRHRLRPLILDPDDPVYPGSPDAPTLAAALTRPAAGPVVGSGMRAPVRPAPEPAPARSPVPLSADPGPLPGGLRSAPPPPPARAGSGLRAAALVAAGAAVVLAGTAGGWTVTRALAGQSPLTTVTVTTERAELRQHVDPLGFRIGVPGRWAEYRFPSADGTEAVSFVSPDGSEELSVQRFPSAAAVGEALTPQRLGVDGVQVGPAAPAPGAPGATQLTYRTVEGSLARTSWLRAVPAGDGAWTVRLTVPAGRAEDTAAGLFAVLAGSFAPADP
jgi:hypothetical protein